MRCAMTLALLHGTTYHYRPTSDHCCNKIYFNVMISNLQAVLLHITVCLSCLVYCVIVLSTLVHSAYAILWAAHYAGCTCCLPCSKMALMLCYIAGASYHSLEYMARRPLNSLRFLSVSARSSCTRSRSASRL